MKQQQSVFSGIQPTGEIHIGNYLGAIKNWASLLEKYECIFCIVDYHAMTIEYDIKAMQDNIRNAVLDNIACGLDPDKCTIFVQSDVPEVTELTWVLSTVTPMGDLTRMTQFNGAILLSCSPNCRHHSLQGLLGSSRRRPGAAH